MDFGPRLIPSGGATLPESWRSCPLNVCVLSAEDAGRLENYGAWPKCYDKLRPHRHISQKEAKKGVEAGVLRWLGGDETKIKHPVSMVVMVRISVWQPVQACLEDGTKVLGLRTWGLAKQR